MPRLCRSIWCRQDKLNPNLTPHVPPLLKATKIPIEG